MSTYWYPFKADISSVRLELGIGHDYLNVWQRGGKCGTLTLDRGTGEAIRDLFRSETPAFQVWASPNGPRITKLEGYHAAITYLINEYGEVKSLQDVLQLGTLEE